MTSFIKRQWNDGRANIERLVLAVFCALVAAIFAAQHGSAVERLEREDAQRLDTLAAVVANEVNESLVAVNAALGDTILDHLSDPNAIDPHAVSRRMRALTNAMPAVRDMGYLDANGVVRASMSADLIGRNFAHRLYFSQVHGNPNRATLYVTSPFVSVRNERVISVARMVTGPGDSFGGVVNAILDPRYFGNSLKMLLYAPGVRASIGDGGGTPWLEVVAPGTVNAHPGNRVVKAEQTISLSSLHMDRDIRIVVARDADMIVSALQAQDQAIAAALAGGALMSFWALHMLQQRRRATTVLQDERARNQALRISETRFRTMIESAPIAVAILRKGQIMYSNASYNLLHGYAAGDSLIGVRWRTLIAAESLAALREQETLIEADAENVLHFDVDATTASGNEISVSKAIVRVDLSDGPATVIFSQDISFQKRATSALLDARNVAEAANRGKTDFLASMSHEIRTPLNAILGLAYLLAQAPLDAEAQSMVARIRVSGNSLLRIINDILDLSKIDAGQMTLETEWFFLQDVIDNVAATMGVAVGTKAIELLIHPVPAEASWLRGDALRIEQLLINLTSNAIKFTSAGSVSLRVELIEKIGSDLTLKFSVADTGAGIPAEMHEKLFSSFVQAEKSTSRRYGGSGLGLSICRKLVDMMKGTIEFTSECGKGSQFWFTISMPGERRSRFSSPDIAELRPLLVASHEQTRTTLIETFASLGWSARPVPTREAAIGQLQADCAASKDDVVFVDMDLAGADGVATVAAIRRAFAPRLFPTVLIASTFEANRIAARPEAALIDALVTKPATASALYNAVLTARQKRAGATPKLPAKSLSGRRSLDGIRILVVDDSEINRDVAKGILSEHGAVTYLAGDGIEALDFLREHADAVDLMLIDLQMPRMDGLEALRRIRAIDKLRRVPVIILSANVFEAQRTAAYEAGADQFLTKPFDIPLTIATIQRLAQRSEAKPQAERKAAGDEPPCMPLDMAAGLQNWRTEERFKDYLQRFFDEFAAAPQRLRELGSSSAAAALAHKMAGAAANVALPQTHRCALLLEQAIAAHAPTEDSIGQLEQAVGDARAAFDAHYPAGAEFVMPVS